MPPPARVAFTSGTALDVWKDSYENEWCLTVLLRIQGAIWRPTTAADNSAAAELRWGNVKYNFWSG